MLVGTPDCFDPPSPPKNNKIKKPALKSGHQFSNPQKSWIRKFQTQRMPSSSLSLDIRSTVQILSFSFPLQSIHHTSSCGIQRGPPLLPYLPVTLDKCAWTPLYILFTNVYPSNITTKQKPIKIL